jgi:hypothetical protein
LERIMDLSHLEPVITVLTWAIHVIEYVGAGLFLLFAVWCALTESVALTATVLRTLLAFPHRRWLHARDALKGVREEIRSWNP